MKKENPFEIDFESYIREGEPDKKEKSIAWSIATGLQQVDGLTPSAYLYETAKRNIEGEISIEEARKLVDSYYESKTARADDENDSEEADKVSARIVQILRDPLFDDLLLPQAGNGGAQGHKNQQQGNEYVCFFRNLI